MVAQPTAGTLGNRGLRSHTELDGHGAYIPVAIQAGATRENPASGPDGIGVRTDGVAYTIEARAEVQAVGQPVPYDLFQITAPVNRQNRKPGDPCHTLARDNAAHAAVAFQQNTRDEVRLMNGDGQIAGALAAEAGMKQQNYLAQSATTPAVAFANRTRDGIKMPEIMADGVTPALTNPGGGGRSDAINVAVATSFIPGNSAAARSMGETEECCVTIKGDGGGSKPHVQYAMTVRRLTPRECERLQGFPDDYTLIPWRKKPAEECPDGPRYRALGNSMAVNCMSWIGERIAKWEAEHER
jgi:site-specific DNA-cytosine methylase